MNLDALTLHGLCTLTTEGDRYVLRGRSGVHTLSIQETPPERLTAHWDGFLGANGGVRPLNLLGSIVARIIPPHDDASPDAIERLIVMLPASVSGHVKVRPFRLVSIRRKRIRNSYLDACGRLMLVRWKQSRGLWNKHQHWKRPFPDEVRWATTTDLDTFGLRRRTS